MRTVNVGALQRDSYVEGTLGGSGMEVESGALWAFEGRAGQVVSVAARSSDFDTTLELWGPTGEVIAENDDAGDGTDAEVSVVLTATGRYVVRVAPYEEEGTGVYQVRWGESDIQALERWVPRLGRF